MAASKTSRFQCTWWLCDRRVGHWLYCLSFLVHIHMYFSGMIIDKLLISFISLEPPALGLVFKCDYPAISARPVQFTKVAHVIGKGLDEAFFWYPTPPPGYASFGCIVTTTDESPKKDLVCCPRLDLVSQANVSVEPISRSSTSKGSNCWSIWKVENQVLDVISWGIYFM